MKMKNWVFSYVFAILFLLPSNFANAESALITGKDWLALQQQNKESYFLAVRKMSGCYSSFLGEKHNDCEAWISEADSIATQFPYFQTMSIPDIFALIFAINSVRPLTETYKAACIEQGGCGLFEGFIGNIAMKLGLEHTENIHYYSLLRKDKALESWGVKAKVEDIPGLSDRPETFVSVIETMIVGDYVAEKSYGSGIMTNEEMSAIYEVIRNKLIQIKPNSREMDLHSGTILPLQMNSLSKLVFGDLSNPFFFGKKNGK